MTSELSDFAARLREMISNRQSATGNRQFSELAHELFALQYRYNPAYQKFCQARGATPNAVKHWKQIPAVPTAAFKELELSCLAPEERTAVFHSSGTTEQIPSRHFHSAESLMLYEASLLPWFLDNVLPDCRLPIADCRLVCLMPSPEQAPHSSLVHMFETVRSRACESAERSFFGTVAADGSWVLNFDAVVDSFRLAIRSQQPAILLGTAFSFVHLLDFLTEHDLRFQLPAGSLVMETGGYKNRSRTMPMEALHALIAKRLGIQSANIICEYGMSELSSQAYDSVTCGEGRVTRNEHSRHLSPVTCHFSFPPWARVRIISPETGRELADGETGLIRVFDLANVFSVMAVQTEDLGVQRGEGFELVGRAQLAEPRGCSLMMDEPLAPALSPPGGERVAQGRVRGTII
jgi:hypothetical protein